ncbi:PTS system fructose subfamily IIA component [Desulfarculus baarsii DSM 2075]|uniref:PTS system fructose subfamily IIA component n=1 Tax=Desulfarculus baarsii (strain ATCC 33931 / DSM 2075 / LMG 7858 / VKM B-1802 / 2st14) TaxID=644282 RepID=E1QL65_DESB2|nr:PTS sugar transporter subunit IIA [Desulfarculus baarsii]ADK85330.1 PTS system fructose subfamily IIA component [Desulfarculus baarsii DSM 2075]
MIGIIVITHARLGRELVNAAEFILGKIERIETISLEPQSKTDFLSAQLEAAQAKVDGGDGVLILTDMFGGTPNNISLAYFDEGKVDVVTGVNLPMVIKAATSRQGKALAELSRAVRQAGHDSISAASELLAS